ncbi:FtsB family cell division protein [Angustibacter sp. McL0619]|uniref:FtsB family cell division protein n=1 Tax=Angustibacter sp. McL0619 TaxID=3415676 RepID=UPI003CF4F68A
MAAGRRPGSTGGSRSPSPGAGRAGARPGAGARTGVRPAPAASARRRSPSAGPRASRTLRLVVLGGVLAVLAVLLAPALRSYLTQRQQIDALRSTVNEQQAQVGDLQKERAAWNDPAYVKAQARDRLKFVMPGEKTYTVIDPRPQVAPSTSPAKAAAGTARSDRSWFDDVWRSAQIAGRGGAAAKP